MKTATIICIFIACILFLFHDFIFEPGVFLDANPVDYDPWRAYSNQEDLNQRTYRLDALAAYLPRRVELTRSIRSGRIPLWNPYAFAGMPFFADPQSRTLYPISLLLVAFDPARAMGYEIAIHLLIALIAMYLFMRRIRVSTAGSAVAALGYALSSFFFLRLGHITFVATASWIPFFFYGYEKARESERAGTLVLIASFSMAYLAGFPQVLAFGVGGLVLYALYVGMFDTGDGGKKEGLLQSVRVLAVSGSLSLLVVAVQLVPFIEYTRNSIGLGVALETMQQVFLAPVVLLVRSVYPNFFGHPLEGTDWSGLVRDSAELHHPDFMVYCGTGALMAALAGLVFLRDSCRIRLFFALLLLSIVLATSPLLMKLLYAVSPLFRATRISRVSVMGCFALSAIAGISFSMAGEKADGARSKRFVLVLVAVLVVVSLGSLAFLLNGESLLDEAMERARSLPEETWLKTPAARSARIRDWAVGDGSEWFQYEKRQLAKGLVYILSAAVLLGIHAWPGSGRPRIRRLAAVVFAVLVAFDVGSMVRSYMVAYPKDSIFETRGIEFLKQRLGDEGKWRIHNLSHEHRDIRGLPPNTNQIFGIPSLKGRATIIPQTYVDLMEASSHMEPPVGLRGRQGPLSPASIHLAEIASARYIVVGKSGTPHMASPLMGMVRSGEGSGCNVQMLELGGESRPAICQDPDRPILIQLAVPPVAALDFAVGLEGNLLAGKGSVVFTLVFESEKGRVEFRRSLEPRLGGGKWHEFRLDISQVSGSAARIWMAISLSEALGSAGLVAGWSGLDLVYGDCPFTSLGDTYEIQMGPEGSYLRLRLKAPASEIPLEVLSGGRYLRNLWIAFPSDTAGRWINLDVAGRQGDVVTVGSASTFSLEMCKRVALGRAYTGLELVYDQDLHIYENFGAIEKGICIDKDSATLADSGSEPVLKIGRAGGLPGGKCGTCRIVSYQPERIELWVSSQSDGYLIFQDLWYPGWHAHVDGLKGDIIRTDSGVRAIRITRGDHRVTMEFNPGSIKIGLILTCLGIGLTFLYSVIGPGLTSVRPRTPTGQT